MSQILRDTFDGVIRIRDTLTNAGRIVSQVLQPGRVSILEGNKRIRNQAKLRKLESMQWALRIPEIDFHQLLLANPDLDSPDGEIKRLAWVKFIQSAESMPYKVRA